MWNDVMASWCVPDDHSRQVSTGILAQRLLAQNPGIETVMDLGCGAGDSVDFFRAHHPTVKWTGLDIENSPEVRVRQRTDAEFASFDGINIPFDDNYFDMIYCNQVLEHVRHPLQLLMEVQRVLKPNGCFLGSTSHLEPYHSYSIWNYTPYGFSLLVAEAGLQLAEIRPGIDALTLIMRLGMGRPRFFSRWWEKESPLNRLIGFAGILGRKSHAEINFAKLIFCGQFCFFARKPE